MGPLCEAMTRLGDALAELHFYQWGERKEEARIVRRAKEKKAGKVGEACKLAVRPGLSFSLGRHQGLPWGPALESRPPASGYGVTLMVMFALAVLLL